MNTGATVSLISERLLEPFQIKLEKSNLNVRDVSHRSVPIKGKILMNIQVPEGTFREYFLVPSKEVAIPEVLLGTNILSKSDILLSKGQINFNPVLGFNKKIKMRPTLQILDTIIYDKEHKGEQQTIKKIKSTKKRLREEINLHLSEEITLPPNTLARRSVKVTGILEGETVLVHRNGLHQRTVMIPDLVTRAREQSIIIEMVNSDNFEIKLQPGTKISDGIILETSDEYITTMSTETESKKVAPK